MLISDADISALKVIDETGEHAVDIRPGGSLLQLFQDSGVAIAAVCGGCMSCGTCHVLLPPALFARLPAPTPDEIELLEESRHYQPGASRLACQISADPLLEGATVTIAPDE